MRIGIDARLAYYQQAGITTYIRGLLRGLERVAPGQELVVFQSRKDRVPLSQAPNFRRVPLWTPCHHRFEQLALPLELLLRPLDVLHSPDFIPPFHRRCRSVITIHDLAFLFYPAMLTPESQAYYRQVGRAVESADAIIAVSENTRRDLVEQLHASQAKVTVIPEAADPVFRPIGDRQAVQREMARYGIKGDFILFVGTIEPRKNLPTLLQAYRLLQRTDVPLLIVGRMGWLADDIVELVHREHLDGVAQATGTVRFLGWVSPEGLVYLYNGARALVLPSLYEGFGLPVLEAMACGTPVITSEVSSLPEVAGDAALTVDPCDEEALASAMKRLLSDDALCEELREKGLARAREFSWERTAAATLEVYRRAAAG